MKNTLCMFAVLLILLSGCETVPALNFNLTPYTSVVKIDLVSKDSDAYIGKGYVTGYTEWYAVFREKGTERTFSFPIRLKTIRAQLGVGTYQIIGTEYKGQFSKNFLSTTKLQTEQTETESSEVHIEFAVTPADLGKEVNLGTFNTTAMTVSGNRLRITESSGNFDNRNIEQ